MDKNSYAATFHNQKFPDVRGRRFENALFASCEFGKAAGAHFVNCVFRNCKFTATDLRDVLGIGLTLDCFVFGGIELSPPIMEALIHLLTLTKGNDAIRKKLTTTIDPAHFRYLQRFFETVERP